MKTIVIYGSTMGNTENAANIIGEKFDGAEVVSVDADALSSIADYDLVILGTSTWGMGELQEDWDMVLDGLGEVDFGGKKVALFGLGDQQSYTDTYLDGMGILYEKVKEAGAEVIGKWPVDGYDFGESRAVVDGAFVGLALDEDCQSSETDGRIEKWVEELKGQL